MEHKYEAGQKVLFAQVNNKRLSYDSGVIEEVKELDKGGLIYYLVNNSKGKLTVYESEIDKAYAVKHERRKIL